MGVWIGKLMWREMWTVYWFVLIEFHRYGPLQEAVLKDKESLLHGLLGLNKRIFRIRK